MLNTAPLIIHDTQDVETALSKIGLSRDIVVEIARSAAAARAESLPVDPSGTPGTLSYIYGVRALRLNLLKHGWRENRQGNVESTVNDEVNVQLFFQNVDVACNHFKNPRAISRKGAASRSLVEAGQYELFDQTNDVFKDEVFGKVPTVWVVCVSVEGFSVRAEVSCPKIFEGCQFEDFHQRIFVLDEEFEPTTDPHRDSDDGYEDFDVEISKK
jgi:hypothetical protein